MLNHLLSQRCVYLYHRWNLSQAASHAERAMCGIHCDSSFIGYEIWYKLYTNWIW